MAISAPAESTTFIIIGIALAADSTALLDMARALGESVGLRVTLVSGARAMDVIAKTAALPYVSTHELAMIREVVVLEYSG